MTLQQTLCDIEGGSYYCLKGFDHEEHEWGGRVLFHSDYSPERATYPSPGCEPWEQMNILEFKPCRGDILFLLRLQLSIQWMSPLQGFGSEGFLCHRASLYAEVFRPFRAIIKSGKIHRITPTGFLSSSIATKVNSPLTAFSRE